MPFSLIAAVIGKIIDALTQGGQLKEQDAQEARKALAEAATQADKTFADFIRSTSPDPASVIGSWTASLYTLVRNAGVVAILAGLFYRPMEETLIAAANGLASAGIVGLLLFSILLWEYYGREALSIVSGNSVLGNVSQRVVIQPTAPPQVAAPATPRRPAGAPSGPGPSSDESPFNR